MSIAGKFTVLFNSSSYKSTLDTIQLEDGTAYTDIIGLHIMINTHEVYENRYIVTLIIFHCIYENSQTSGCKQKTDIQILHIKLQLVSIFFL